MHELIRAFIDHVSTRKTLSPNTIAAYLYDLHKFNAYLDSHALSLEQVTPRHLRTYTAQLKQSFRPATLARNIATLRSFWNYARTVQKLTLKPLPFKLPTLTKKPAPSFAPQLLEVVINANTRDRSVLSFRNVLITYFLCRLRISPTQLAMLKVADVTLTDSTLYITTKQKKRDITLPEQVAVLLKEYTKTLTCDSYLFPAVASNNTQALPRQAFWSIAKKCLRLANSIQNGKRSVRYIQYYHQTTLTPPKSKTSHDRLRAVYEQKHPRS